MLRLLWKLINVAQREQLNPRPWQRARGIFIPKEKDSIVIENFRLSSQYIRQCSTQKLSSYLKGICELTPQCGKPKYQVFLGAWHTQA